MEEIGSWELEDLAWREKEELCPFLGGATGKDVLRKWCRRVYGKKISREGVEKILRGREAVRVREQGSYVVWLPAEEDEDRRFISVVWARTWWENGVVEPGWWAKWEGRRTDEKMRELIREAEEKALMQSRRVRYLGGMPVWEEQVRVKGYLDNRQRRAKEIMRSRGEVG